MSRLILTPCSTLAGGTAWRVLAPSARIAAAIARATGGETQPAGDGGRQVIIRRSALDVTAIGLDGDMLRVALPGVPDVLAIQLREWPGVTAIDSPGGLPADGTLTVNSYMVRTRMGRRYRALVPVFTSATIQRGEVTTG